MRSLVVPMPYHVPSDLTHQLRLKRYWLLEGPNAIAEHRVCHPSYEARFVLLKGNFTLYILLRAQLTKLGAIRVLQTRRKDPKYRGIASNYPQLLLECMRIHLESLKSMSPPHHHYVTFVQQIVAEIRSHASEYRTDMKFFLRTSSGYWPHKDDPNLYGAGLDSYCHALQSAEALSKTESELFYYLNNGWNNALRHAHMKRHMAHVTKALSHTHFVRFVLRDFLPAVLHVGFNVRGGWVLAATYLPTVGRALTQFIWGLLATERLREEFFLDIRTGESFMVFLQLTSFLNVIIESIRTHLPNLNFNGEVNPRDRGMLAVVFDLGYTILPCLIEYATKAQGQSMAGRVYLDELRAAAGIFVNPTYQAFADLPSIPVKSPEQQSKHRQLFVGIMTEDLKRNWKVESDDRLQGVDVRQYRPRPIEEILQKSQKGKLTKLLKRLLG